MSAQERRKEIRADIRLLKEAIEELEKEDRQLQWQIQAECDHEYSTVDSHESWCRKCGHVWYR